MTDNPLLQHTSIPAYDKIQTAHFMPALDAALANAQQALAALRASNATDFAGTVVPLESLFDQPGAVMGIINTFNSNIGGQANSDASAEAKGKYDAFAKEVYQDAGLAARVKALHDSAATLALDAQDTLLLRQTYKAFVDNGAYLSAQAQQQIRAIDARLIDLAQKFDDNLNDGAVQQAVHITDPAELAGVPATIIADMRAQAQAAGQPTGWTYVPERLQVDALLSVAENREFRRKIFTALNAIGTQAPHDSRPVIQEMQKLRQDRTALVGTFGNYAESALDGTMAGSLQRAEDVLRECAKAIVPAFERDIAAIAAYAAQNGGPATLEPWDSPYWAERYKADKHQFDAAAFSDYLEMGHVVDTMFSHFQKLFNVTIVENTAHPKFHADIRTYDVTDAATGAPIGVLYCDLYARKGTKNGGAWMDHLQHRDDKAGKVNVVSLNMNCEKPAPGQPTLLAPDTVETFYHECGHAFHGLLGTNTRYKSAQGPGISSDFFEIHSTAQEYFAFTRERAQQWMKHHKTAQPVPGALLDTYESSATFFKSRNLMLMIQNALRDLEFHKRPPAQYGSDKDIEQTADFPGAASKHVRSYPLTRFGHLFTEGLSAYAAGYYGYFWSELQSAAVFDTFKARGLYDRATADKLTAFYAKGAREEPNAMFEAFNGGPAAPEALLRATGIIAAKKPEPPAPRTPHP